MKKHIYPLVLFFAGFVIYTMLSTVGYSQATVMINNPPGDSSQYYPFNAEDNFSRSVSLYEWASLNIYENFSGNITCIGYSVKDPSVDNTFYIGVYLKPSAMNNFPEPANWATLVSDADTVFEDSCKFDLTGWETLELNPVYQIDENINLMVFCEQLNTMASNPPKFSYTAQSSNVHAFMSDSFLLDQLETNTLRPDIQITYISNPLDFQVVDPTASTLTLNWRINTSDSALIVRSDSDDFTDPAQGDITRPDIDSAFCNGTVIEISGDTSYTDASLGSDSTYYYKILSFYKSDKNHYFYSPGDVKSGTTYCFNIQNSIEFSNGKDTTTICEGNNPGVIIGFVMDPEARYQWYYSLNNYSYNILENDTLQNYSPENLSITTFYKRRAFKDGCEDYSNVATVYVDPKSDAGEISGDPIACQNQTYEFIIEGSVGDVQYWEKSQDLIVWNTISNSADTILQHSFSDSDTNYLHAIVISGVCESDISESFLVYVNAQPTASITTPTSVCVFDSLQILIEPNDPLTTIEWFRDHPEITGIPNSGSTSIISGTLTAVITESVDVTFTITLTSNTDPPCTNIYETLVQIKPTPPPNNILGEENVCWGGEFKYTLEDQESDITYQWNLDDPDVGEIVGSTTKETVVVKWNKTNIPASSDLIVVRKYEGYNCINTNQLSVTVNPGKAPVDSLIRKFGPDSDTNTLFLMCTKYINDSAQSYSFDWGYKTTNGNEISNTVFTDRYFCVFESYEMTNQYFVDIAYKDKPYKCSTRTCYNATVQTITKEYISLYPNPNSGDFTVDISSEYIGKATIELINIMGAMVHRLHVFKDQYRQTFPVNMHGLASGIYFLKIQFGNGAKKIQIVSVY